MLDWNFFCAMLLYGNIDYINFMVFGNPDYKNCWLGFRPDDDEPFWFDLSPYGSHTYYYKHFCDFEEEKVFNGLCLDEIWFKVCIYSVNGVDFDTWRASNIPVVGRKSLNGRRFSDIDGFYNEIYKISTEGLDFTPGHDTITLNKILNGGFGVHKYGQPIYIDWYNFNDSRLALGDKVVNDLIAALLKNNAVNRRELRISE